MTALMNPTAPTEDEQRQAQETSRALAPLLDGDVAMQITVKDGPSESLPLPASAARLLYEILRELADGHPVTVLPVHAELTTQQAADYLNVSRPYLIKLIDAGQIPCHKVGSHRRIHLQDIADYKRDFLAKRHAALDELTALSQELGLYD